VVKLGVVIGNTAQTAEFILSERTHKRYQAQVGRSILSDIMVVDVGRKHLLPYVVPEEATAGVE
jgi:hypothetical protein